MPRRARRPRRARPPGRARRAAGRLASGACPVSSAATLLDRRGRAHVDVDLARRREDRPGSSLSRCVVGPGAAARRPTAMCASCARWARPAAAEGSAIGAGAATAAAATGAADRRGRRSTVADRPDRHGTHRGQRLAALEIPAAPGAERPLEADELRAVRADALEARPAGRADDPVLVDLAAARGAVLDLLDLGDQRLLRETALVGVAEALLRPDDPVDEDAEDEEDRREPDHERRGEIGHDRVRGPALHVAEGPVGRGEPDDDDVDADRLEAQLDERALEEGGDRVADPGEEVQVHAVGSPTSVRGAPSHPGGWPSAAHAAQCSRAFSGADAGAPS